VSGLGHINYYADSSVGAAAKSGAVFLAEGTTGADALAVGPIAADTNTPVLLTSGTSLAGATASALAALKPANIFVLGGQAAVPDAVASTAKTAAGSTNAPIRISGATLYATSVALAEQLDNLWPQNATNQLMQDQNKFVNQGFGLARSEGSGLDHVGWPDALSSGLVLTALHSGTGTVPLRLAPPVEANPSPFAAASTLGGTAGPSRFPLLLTPGSVLAPEVDAYLKGLYPAATRTASTGSTVDQGGFGYVFGGQAAILPTAELTMAQDLSGGTYTVGANRSDLAPGLASTGVYYTAMDLTNYRNTVSGEGGINIPLAQAGAGDKVCLARGAAGGVQNLDIAGTTALLGTPNGIGYEVSGAYSPGKSIPMCFPAAALPTQTARVIGVSLSGSVSAFANLSWAAASSTLHTDTPASSTLTSSVSETPPVVGNIDTAALPGSPTTLTATYTFANLGLTYKGTHYTSGTGTLQAVITRTNAQAPMVNDSITCTGTFTFKDASSATVFVIDNIAADSASEPTASPGPVRCAGEYGIGRTTGGIRFAVNGDKTPTLTVTDFVVDGNG
jgi:hypothetical protein